MSRFSAIFVVKVLILGIEGSPLGGIMIWFFHMMLRRSLSLQLHFELVAVAA